jgi:hypothetical protein
VEGDHVYHLIRKRRSMKRTVETIILGTGLIVCHVTGHADGLDQWHLRYSPDGGGELSSIAFSEERFVAVGPNGRIVTSTNAIQWTLADSGTMVNLSKVAFGNGAFVATGIPDTVMRSTNGTNWQSAGWQEPATRVRAIAFANDQFFLLADDEGGCGPMLFVSSTGTEWSRNRMQAILCGHGALLGSLAYGNGNYVAVGRWTDLSGLFDGGPLVMVSQDTFTWEHIPLSDMFLWLNSVVLESVAFGKGLFVAVGRGVNLVSFIAHSADGRNWKVVNDVFVGVKSVAYADGVFVAAGVGQIATSTDGIHWRKRDPGHDFAIFGITYGQNTFVSIVGGTQIWQSDPVVVLGLNRSSPTELSITGPVGKSCQVDATEDLGATNGWATVASFVLTNSPATWIDSDSTDKSQRFYRAVLQP